MEIKKIVEELTPLQTANWLVRSEREAITETITILERVEKLSENIRRFKKEEKWSLNELRLKNRILRYFDTGEEW